MKKFYLIPLFLACSLWSFSQTTVSTTYSAGLISSDFQNNVNINDNSSCAGALIVPVPAGRYVTSVDVSYDIEATGGAWLSEQFSYLECVTTLTKENSISTGQQVSTGGTHTYNRTGLTFANGIVPSGGLQFKLHVFRSWGPTGCGTNFQRVPNNTFTITVTHAPPPTCPEPTAISVSSVGTNDATISWTTGGAGDWQIEYGTAGFALGTGTVVNAPTNPFTLTGLMGGTSYDFRVRDSCGVGDVSFWSPIKGFRTNCASVPAPWTEDFEAADWISATLSNLGSIDTCFTRNHGNSFTWETGPPQFLSGFSGPSGDHTTGNGKYIFTEMNNFISIPDTAEIETPIIDLSPLTTPELSFWYHMYGSAIGELQVLISIDGGSTFTRLWSVSGNQQNSQSDPWKERIINLSTYANNEVVIKFIGIQIAFSTNCDISIDDIDIHEQPSCPKPADLQVVGTTSGSLTLGWTSGGASDWEVEYGSPGFALGSGTRLAAASNPFTITGLAANTAYEFYVRDSCGLNDVSAWIGPIGDTTDCLPLSAPYSEDFEGSDFTAGNFWSAGSLNNCWERDNTVNYMWLIQSTNFTFGTAPDGDHTTGSGQFLQASRMTTTNRASSVKAEVFTPLIDLSPLGTPELSFWYHSYGADIDSMVVDVFDGTTWNRGTSIVGQEQTSKTDPWKEAIVNISALADDTVKVRFSAFRAGVNSNLVNIAIDDLSIHEQPTCPRPTGLSVASSSANSVSLAWTGGGASDWQIEYGPAGFAPGTGTIVNTSTNPFTVTGLNSSTTYEFYVRDSCGPGDVSAWHGSVRIATDCLPLLAPFLETFDGAHWVAGQNFNDTGEVANCWKRNPLIDYLWKPGPGAFPQFGTGPAADHTSGSGQYIFTETIFGSNFTPPFTAHLETPLIDLSSLSVPQLNFWYHMYGGNIGTLEVQVDDGSGYTTVHTLSGEDQSAGTDPWEEVIVNLSSYANDTIQVRFKAEKTILGSLADLAIDDVQIQEAPSCPRPDNLSSISTSDGFVLSWVSGGAGNWQIEYGPQGFTPGTGTRVNVSSNPFTLTGLSSSTVYDIYVRDSCGVGDVSDWEGPKTDTTLCSVFSVPFSENFDGAEWGMGFGSFDPGSIDQCWERTDTTTYFWRAWKSQSPSGNTGPSQDHTTGSGKYIYTELTQFNNLSTMFLSPLIDCSSLTSPQLRFWYHMHGAGIDKLEVDVWDGTSWTNEASIIGQQQSTDTDPWIEEVVDLSAYANDTVRVRFKGFRNNTGGLTDMAIDDFWLGEAPTCPRPSNLSLSSITTNSVTLDWTTAGASHWLIGYKPTGSSGPLTIVPTSVKPFVVSGLNPSTSYTFYVKDSCAAGDVSLWHGPQLTTTLCGVVTAPWSEGFDSPPWISGTGFQNANNQISPCWSRPSANNPNFGTHFGPTSSTGTGPSGDVSGSGNYLYTESSGGASGTGSITTPFIAVPLNLLNPRLIFHYHMHGTSVVSFEVEISTGGGFTSVFTLNGQQQGSESAAWIADSVDLTSYAGDTIQVRFSGTNNNFGGDIGLDEVSVIGDVNPCAEPTNLLFNPTSSLSAEVSWTSQSGMSDVEIVPLGQAQGTGVLYQNVVSPLTVNSLLPDSSYTVYVRDSCAGIGSSNWINGAFTTPPCDTPAVNFSYARSVMTVSFNSSGTVADSLHWEFGDGNISAAPNPNHTYSAKGKYQVKLIAFNFCGISDTLTDSVKVCGPVTAIFNYSQVGDTVSFDAAPSIGGYDYYWDFGDSNDSTGMQVSHVYAGSSNRMVTLIVVNECGDSASATQLVEICQPPVPSWTYTVLGTTGNGMEVQFDGSASQNAVSFEWDFGDGATASGTAQPVHTYLTPGLFYTVTLRITNDCGQKKSLKFRLDKIGLEELEALSRIELYPNPADERVIVEWSWQDLEVRKIELTDVSGRILRHYEVSGETDGKMELDLGEISSGYFLLRIYTDRGVKDRRLILR